jgi:uncharacterized protein
MKASSCARYSLFPLLVAAVLAFFSPSSPAQAANQLPRPTDYVSDFAHVLSPEAIEHIDSVCAQLDHSAANAQVAVVTVSSLDGDDSSDYANALEDKWKMGRKGSDRGVLVLLAVNDHKYRIEVGYGLEGILPDGKVGDIGRSMIPNLRANDYDGALTLAVGQVAQVLADDAHVTLDENAPGPERGPPVRHNSARSSGIAKLVLLMLLLVFFGGSSLLRMIFGWGLFFGGLGGGGGGFGGGGFSGGGGGGGGGFGGFGGGGFGGGGAGGSW